MNVFILNTGRCGSTTIIKACSHITNYSAGHETLAGHVGEARLAFPPNHIEADNRLSWFLGRLDRHYGDDAIYVHLQRDREATARSFAQRYGRGVIRAYEKGILMRAVGERSPLNVARDYCDTVDSNIELFLRDKTRKMNFDLMNAAEDFPRFWELIGAEGSLEAAMAEFTVHHNATQSSLKKLIGKLSRRR